MSWKVFLQDRLRFAQMGYRLYVAKQEYDQAYTLMFNPTMHRLERGAFFPEDEFFISDEQPDVDVRSFLQAMSDAAWEIGIKPKQLEDQRNELSAVRFHLEDMRQLAGVKK